MPRDFSFFSQGVQQDPYLETIRGKRGISIAASEIARATATP
jgi:hypothetical protein